MAIKKKDAPFQPSGETRRIIPLGGGTHAYLFDHLGKTHRCKVDSPEFSELCRSVDAELNGRISKELAELGWDHVLYDDINFVQLDDVELG